MRGNLWCGFVRAGRDKERREWDVEGTGRICIAMEGGGVRDTEDVGCIVISRLADCLRVLYEVPDIR